MSEDGSKTNSCLYKVAFHLRNRKPETEFLSTQSTSFRRPVGKTQQEAEEVSLTLFQTIEDT